MEANIYEESLDSKWQKREKQIQEQYPTGVVMREVSRRDYTFLASDDYYNARKNLEGDEEYKKHQEFLKSCRFSDEYKMAVAHFVYKKQGDTQWDQVPMSEYAAVVYADAENYGKKDFYVEALGAMIPTNYEMTMEEYYQVYKSVVEEALAAGTITMDDLNPAFAKELSKAETKNV